MSPLTAYQNARFGGASAIDAGAWRKGDATSPIVVTLPATASKPVVPAAPVVERAVPVPHVELPVRNTTLPLVRSIPVSLPALTPSLPSAMPVFHAPAPSHSVHSTPAHPPA